MQGAGGEMRGSVMALVLLAGPAMAGDWAVLDGTGVTSALTDKTVVYEDGTKQIFKADGGTIYDNGQQSLGHWNVQANQYCSVWPPSDHWACYGVEASGDGIRFVAADGSATTGKVQK